MYLTVFTCSILLIQVQVALCSTTVTTRDASDDDTSVSEMMTSSNPADAISDVTTLVPSDEETTLTEMMTSLNPATTKVPSVTQIGGKCVDNSSCAIQNSICRNYTCECKYAFFKFNDTTCFNVSRPEAPSDRTVLLLNENILVLRVKRPAKINGGTLQYNTTVYTRLYENQTMESKVTQASTTSDYTNLTIPLSPGVNYNVLIFSKNEMFTSIKSLNASGQADEIAPEEVLFINNVTTTNISARIPFTRPRIPNGFILGYIYSLRSVDGITQRSGNCNLTGNIFHCNENVTLQENHQNLVYSFKTLESYTSYNLQITAFNGAGKGTNASINFMTAVGFPLKPSITKVADETSTSATVSWSVGETKGPTQFKACIYNDATKCCYVGVDDKRRYCMISNLRPFTNYRVVVTSTTDAGSINSDVSPNFITRPGAPHNFLELKLGKIRATHAEIKWLYGIETGVTRFNVKVIDEIDKKTLLQEECKDVSYSSESQSCTFTRLEESWRYQFEIVVTVVDVQKRLVETLSFTTRTSEPGPPQSLRYTSFGRECDSQQYYVNWKAPGRKDRNGCIEKYLIQYMENEISKKVIRCNQYSRSNASYIMAVATVPGQTVYTSIYTVLKDSKRSTKATIKIERPTCGLSPLAIALIVISLFVGILSGILCFIVASKWRGRGSSVPIQTLGSSLIRTFSRKRLRRNRPVAMDSLPLIVDKMKKNSNHGFASEFQDLNDLSIRRPAMVALSEENRMYNRYNDIYPFDESRVKLSSHHTDYINASYIPGYIYEREYIAAQGPLPRTVNDFWKMIWEQDVSVIVMLTRCQEGQVIKCEQYWPTETNQTTSYGEIEVTVVSIPKHNDQETISQLHLKMGRLEKKVMHFHFLIWRDHSASMNPGVLINFIGEVRKHFDVEAGPMTIHCSAGVGRSGTFIAVDYFLQYVREHDLNDEVDIFEYVLKMRDHRVKMVQNEEQYRFVYEAVKEMVKAKRERLNSTPDSVLNMPDNESEEEEELEEEEEEEEEGEEEVNEEDKLKDHETESDEEESNEEDEESGAISSGKMENKASNSVELLDDNQIADNIPIIQNEHQTTEL